MPEDITPESFKIGDRVKLLDNLPPTLSDRVGRIGTIREFLVGWVGVELDTSGESLFVQPNEIEHVKETS